MGRARTVGDYASLIRISGNLRHMNHTRSRIGKHLAYPKYEAASAKSSYIHFRGSLLLSWRNASLDLSANYAVKQGGIRAYHTLVKYWEIVTQKIPGVLLWLMGIVLEVQAGVLYGNFAKVGGYCTAKTQHQSAAATMQQQLRCDCWQTRFFYNAPILRKYGPFYAFFPLI